MTDIKYIDTNANIEKGHWRIVEWTLIPIDNVCFDMVTNIRCSMCNFGTKNPIGIEYPEKCPNCGAILDGAQYN